MSFASPAPDARRQFLAQLAGGALAISAVPALADAESAPSSAPAEPWLAGAAAAKHRQVFDAPRANDGWPMVYVGVYVGTMGDTYKLGAKATHALLVIRHFGAMMGYADGMWAKYRLGEMSGVNDPQTKAPAARNIFAYSKPGDVPVPDFTMDKLMAMGVTVCVCNAATHAIAGMVAQRDGLKADDVYNDLKANLLAGAHLVPSGVLAIGRAQEAGCTYCFTG